MQKTVRVKIAIDTTGRTEEILLRDGTSDVATFYQIIMNQEYNIMRLARGPEILTMYELAVKQRQTPLIVDCGAFIGLSPLYFYHHFPQSRIIAIEPADDNFRLLNYNCQEYHNIVALHAAIGNSAGLARIVDRTVDTNAYRTERVNENVDSVPIISVAQILNEQEYNDDVFPFIVKIDIEGAEVDLFAKNTEWINRFPLLIIELHDWLFPGQGSSGPFLSAISRENRDFVYIGENVFSIRN